MAGQGAKKGVWYVAGGLTRVKASGDELAALMDHASAAVLLTSDTGRSLTDAHGGAVRVPLSKLRDHVATDDLMLLGLEGEAPLFACEVSEEHPQGSAEERVWTNVRAEGPNLPLADAAILSLAASLTAWKRSAQFCGKCGGKMKARNGGLSRACTVDGCRNRVYPRVDPAIITLITCQDFCLLGHSKRWAPGRYSLLAGFAEVCETLEHAVVREVFEEAGVRVKPDSVRFVASQPWPFPSSLMLGFTAEMEGAPTAGELADPPEVDFDNVEITDARWVHRDFLALALRTAVHVPPEVAIVQGGEAGEEAYFSIPGENSLANVILSRWLDQLPAESWEGLPVQDVLVDREGEMKYMLLRVTNESTGHSKMIVRGDQRAAYHRDVVAHTERELKDHSLKIQECGGGTIIHKEDGSILACGCSSQFGEANHAITATLLKRFFPFNSCTYKMQDVL